MRGRSVELWEDDFGQLHQKLVTMGADMENEKEFLDALRK